MKKILFIKFIGLMAILLAVISSSCSKEESGESIVGTWYGTHSYYNPAGGTKYQYLTLRFYADKTGELEYEGPVNYVIGKFSYEVSGSSVRCRGVKGDINGELDLDFTMSLTIAGDRLIPQDTFTTFILTRDGSVETGGDGNIAENDTDLIYGVWIHNSNEVILVLEPSKFTEYTLLSPSSNVYSKKTSGSFSYEYRQKYVLINSVRFDVNFLTETSLQLKKADGKTILNYKRGSEADIPSNGEGQINYQTLLESHLYWRDTNKTLTLSFHHSGKVSYIRQSSKKYGTEYLSLSATGTYWISGKEINCVFEEVYWNYGNSGAKDYFPGWEFGEKTLKIFTLESVSTESLKLKLEDGKTYLFYPFA